MDLIEDLIGFISNIIKKILGLFNIESNKNYKTKKENTIYEIKSLMTNYERKFYNILEKLGEEYRIIPQLNLASVVKKKNNNRYYTDLFRNIDFAIFDKNLNTILLLIEIDDETHKKRKRKQRDLKVKKICNDVGIRMIHFYTKYPNDEQYVINRIKKELENVFENKQDSI